MIVLRLSFLRVLRRCDLFVEVPTALSELTRVQVNPDPLTLGPTVCHALGPSRARVRVRVKPIKG